jgi:ribosome biogenesis protein ERB1
MKKEDLLQELPSVQDMKPFPSKCVIKSLTSFAHAVAFDISPDDSYAVIGDAFGNVIVMHLMTSVIINRLKVEGGQVVSVKFLTRSLLMLATERTLKLIAIRFNGHDFDESCEHFEGVAQSQYAKNFKLNDSDSVSEFNFTFPAAVIKNDIVHFKKSAITELMTIKLRTNRIVHLDVHHKNDFVVLTVARPDDSRRIHIINLSKCSSAIIQVKARTKIRKCIFHNSKPLIFIMTQTHVFLFELQKQSVKKKLVSGCAGLLDLAIHQTGDHLIVSTADSKVLWFDLDSGQYPYKKLKVHHSSVNSCVFSSSYQLFASASSEGEIVVQHAMIESESFGYPTITPIKMLANQFTKGNKSIEQVKFLKHKYFLAGLAMDGQIMIWA